MHQANTHYSKHRFVSPKGGSDASPRLRSVVQSLSELTGLTEEHQRYDLLLLVKRVGRSGGFSSRMIELLDYYMSFTRECDWMAGSRPIVYQSLAKTALDLGVSERQIQRLERSLADLGALTWHHSGNHKRFGQRCTDTGEILFAFGVDLSLLAELRPSLEKQLAAKKTHDRLWMETKRQISWFRGQIRSILMELPSCEFHEFEVEDLECEYQTIAMPIRTHMSLERLQQLLDQHRELHGRISRDAEHEQDLGLSLEMSPRDDADVVHNKNTTQKQSNKLDTGRAKPNCLRGVREDIPERNAPKSEWPEVGRHQSTRISTGLDKVTLSQVLRAASPRFLEYLPINPRGATSRDITEAAFRLRMDLRISQRSWGEACQTVGRMGAALCVLLTDRALDRDSGPVRIPAAYFSAMIRRARTGELRVDRSILGLAKGISS